MSELVLLAEASIMNPGLSGLGTAPVSPLGRLDQVNGFEAEAPRWLQASGGALKGLVPGYLSAMKAAAKLATDKAEITA